MNVKKYTAATTRDALRMVRDELGDEAVILSNRKVSDGIEIMAMSDEDYADITKISPQPDSPIPKLVDIPQLNDRVELSKRSTHFRQPVFSTRPPASQPLRQTGNTNRIPNLLPAEINKPAMPLSVSPEQQNMMKEIKSMRSMLQEQFACMAWSDKQQRDPKRTRLLRNLVNAGFSAGILSRN